MAKKTTEETPVEVSKSKRTLRVQLTNAELLEQAQKMAENTECAENAEAEQKATVTHYKAVREEAEGKARAARTLLRNGYDYRAVDVTITKDWGTKRVTINRDDTGEVVEVRDMTASELQLPIPEEATEEESHQ